MTRPGGIGSVVPLAIAPALTSVASVEKERFEGRVRERDGCSFDIPVRCGCGPWKPCRLPPDHACQQRGTASVIERSCQEGGYVREPRRAGPSQRLVRQAPNRRLEHAAFEHGDHVCHQARMTPDDRGGASLRPTAVFLEASASEEGARLKALSGSIGEGREVSGHRGACAPAAAFSWWLPGVGDDDWIPRPASAAATLNSGVPSSARRSHARERRGGGPMASRALALVESQDASRPTATSVTATESGDGLGPRRSKSESSSALSSLRSAVGWLFPRATRRTRASHPPLSRSASSFVEGEGAAPLRPRAAA